MTDRDTARRRLADAYGRLLDTRARARPLRPLVAQSWQRCAGAGTGRGDGWLPPVEPVDGRLAERREQHPLAPALPLLDELLSGDGHLWALTDTDGTLLWVDGDPAVRRRAERINFVPGADWAERAAGTNAPGTALATGLPVRIAAAEHYNPAVHPWSCSAVPVRDPGTGRLLGALDITGGPDAAGAFAFGLVRAAARAVEARLFPTPGAPPADEPRLAALGRDRAVVSIHGQRRVLCPRHSEIMVILAGAPGGMSAERLAVDLSVTELATVTVRAQMSRLRALLAADPHGTDPPGINLLGSHPYTLLRPLAADFLDVGELIAAGRVDEALRRYPGPLLPSSEAPAVRAHRDALEQSLRTGVLRSGDPALLHRWISTPWAHDDEAAWRALARCQPARAGMPCAPASRDARP